MVLPPQDVPTEQSSIIDGILRAVAGSSAAQVAHAVRVVSGDIMRRCPDGDFWGPSTSTSTVGGSSKALARYQLATRLVKGKLGAHQSLIDALRVAVSAYLTYIHTYIPQYSTA
jgi:hypothetical protein